ncbi:MAG: Holliday junction branch migration protein RuvA [Chloroflexi bacterium]|nr:Holliday junction branch migration protein RuvA [Chloroflexota bacterium]
MISSLRGLLAHRANDHVIVEVGGVGFKVSIPVSTLATLGDIGDRVHLLTFLYIREDNLALYGFATEDERQVFELLLSVSGVGPRVALGILSAMSPDTFRASIATGNTAVLTRIPGIGSKLAGRIALELKGKIDARSVTGQALEIAGTDSDVLAALTNLGYSATEAQAAVRSLPTDGSQSTEDRILAALRYFAGK